MEPASSQAKIDDWDVAFAATSKLGPLIDRSSMSLEVHMEGPPPGARYPPLSPQHVFARLSRPRVLSSVRDGNTSLGRRSVFRIIRKTGATCDYPNRTTIFAHQQEYRLYYGGTLRVAHGPPGADVVTTPGDWSRPTPRGSARSGACHSNGCACIACEFLFYRPGPRDAC